MPLPHRYWPSNAPEGTRPFKDTWMEEQFGRSDLIPFWVSDIEVPYPQHLTESLLHQISLSTLSYCYDQEHFCDTLRQWLHRKVYTTAKSASPLHMAFTPGYMFSLASILSATTAPGEAVTVFDPCYPSTLDAIHRSGRTVRFVPLRYGVDGNGVESYTYDESQLTEALKATRTLIVCNPDNPTGKVWCRQELKAIDRLAERHGATVIADETLSDFCFARAHTPYMTASDHAGHSSLTLFSLNKTFGTGGLMLSMILSQNPTKLAMIEAAIMQTGYCLVNPLSMTLLEHLMKHGNPWHHQVIRHIHTQANQIHDALSHLKPRVHAPQPEGGLSLWVNGQSWHGSLAAWFIDHLKVAVLDGAQFGPTSDQHVRISLNGNLELSTLLSNRLRAAYPTQTKAAH